MSLYPPPVELPAEVWTTIPDEFRRTGAVPDWAMGNKQGEPTDCFLEGPSFDRDGNLYVTDIPFGRVFRISPDGQWTLITEYDGWPNGLKLHKDGRIFITDYKRGIMQLDPANGEVTPVLTNRRSESFRGTNDLVFDSNGIMYFTDQGQTGMHDPTGRVYRYNLENQSPRSAHHQCPEPQRHRAQPRRENALRCRHPWQRRMARPPPERWRHHEGQHLRQSGGRRQRR